MTDTIDKLMALVACPLCGGDEGYSRRPGDTYRWENLHCDTCGEPVIEVRATVHVPLTDRTVGADTGWNEAGAYAHRLRQALDKIAERTDSDDPCRALVQIARDALRHNDKLKGGPR